jgi:hypothetical protein
MGVLEAVARIVQLGGAPERAGRVAKLRGEFEARTGGFVPEDPWFEERSRAFWCDAVTGGGFGRAVEAELKEDERRWLGSLQRAHRGLFRMSEGMSEGQRADGPTGPQLVDVWSGAEFRVTLLDELATRAELDASLDGAQLFDARLIGAFDPAEPLSVVLLPGAVFHPREATAAIYTVLDAARRREMTTPDVLDALLRMERTLRSLSRVKASYAYRPDALAPRPLAEGAAPGLPVRRAAKGPR